MNTQTHYAYTQSCGQMSMFLSAVLNIALLVEQHTLSGSSTNIMPSCPCQQKSCVTVSSWPHIIQNTLLVDHKVFVSSKTQTPLCILKFTLYSLHSTTKLNGTSGDAYIFGNYYVTVRADQSSASKHGPVCHEYEAIGVKMKQKRQDVTCHRLQKNSLEQICCTGFPSFHSTYYFEFLNVLNSWVHP